jgi:hypothetical protein
VDGGGGGERGHGPADLGQKRLTSFVGTTENRTKRRVPVRRAILNFRGELLP